MEILDFEGVSDYYDYGVRELFVEIIGKEQWEKGDLKRTYFQFSDESSKKHDGIQKIYTVQKGPSRDYFVEVQGVKFFYQLGFCNSTTKGNSARDCVEYLGKKLIEKGIVKLENE